MKALPMLVLIAVAALSAASCRLNRDQQGGTADDGRGSGGTQGTTKVPPRAPAKPWPAEAPDPAAACNAHSECAVEMWGAYRAPDPCCQVSVGFWPVTRAYLEFTRRYREQHCAGVTCPALPLPGPEPICCASIGRCVNHKCIGGCEDPTLDAPKVPWIETSCSMMSP